MRVLFIGGKWASIRTLWFARNPIVFSGMYAIEHIFEHVSE